MSYSGLHREVVLIKGGLIRHSKFTVLPVYTVEPLLMDT